jgi:LmbE family N-acetylglucosaminyl deacetylase
VFDWPSAQHVYLSPHLDDVVLSCGGSLFQQARRGETIAVVTVFAGSPLSGRLSPFAEELHQRWQNAAPTIDLSDPSAVRRLEDFRALRHVSATIRVMHLPLLDCIYRTNAYGETLYDSREQIFGTVSGDDPAASVLEAIGPPPPGMNIYAPLGVGHHVDHQIVQQWVENWALPPTRVRYYEDYPYAADEAALIAVTEDRPGWERTVVSINKRALKAKIEAVACYETQISSFWVDVEVMSGALTEQADRSGGEGFWVQGS